MFDIDPIVWLRSKVVDSRRRSTRREPLRPAVWPLSCYAKGVVWLPATHVHDSLVSAFNQRTTRLRHGPVLAIPL